MDKKIIQKPNFRTFSHGLLMGIADSVPGVSGGTIALIIGIYYKLIESLTVFLNFFKDGFPSKSLNNFLSSFFFSFTIGFRNYLFILFSY